MTTDCLNADRIFVGRDIIDQMSRPAPFFRPRRFPQSVEYHRASGLDVDAASKSRHRLCLIPVLRVMWFAPNARPARAVRAGGAWRRWRGTKSGQFDRLRRRFVPWIVLGLRRVGTGQEPVNGWNSSMARGQGMRRSVNGRWDWSLLVAGMFLVGCQSDVEPPVNLAPSFPGVSMKVGALDDGAILAGVSPQRGEWQASRHGEIAIRDEPLTLETLSNIDVVLFPAQRLGDLVDAGVLAPIPNAAVRPPRPADEDTGSQGQPEPDGAKTALDDTFQYMDIAPAFREGVSKYGPERVALPCGGSALVIVYRRDALESDANRAAARQAGLSLEALPTTWPQLDALARFFEGRDWNGDGAADHGIALALGADKDGVGDAAFLARAASVGLHRDHYSFLFDADDMAPRITSPPFVESLRDMIALKAYGPPGMERFDAAAARESFRTGKVALLIDRAERAATWSHGKPVGVAPLPGSERVYDPTRREWTSSSPRNAPSYLPRGGGWLIGINGRLSGTQLAAALDFAKYLANPENCNRLRAERAFSMLPVRTSQMGQGLPDPISAPDVDSRLWSDAVSRTLLAERVVPELAHSRGRGLSERPLPGEGGRGRGRAARKGTRGCRQGVDRTHQGPGREAAALALPA